ncbi:hypothetical protein PILCRDRAFT_817015 [Piloderma croceum F 1598]|uniref:Uncharacterized protein n=1 Tax=Piloderma croceum (strain F 1598) TaxID=765440 RepID=A0A0C3FPA6_PILCF|nr:hypothetical protein PILCRDRAFT_817015 [Piloderma croceum F 1598]
MSYVIFGRAIKNEYLTLATLFSVGAIGYAATSGGSKKAASASSSGKTLVEKVKEAVPINAGSSEEEQLMDSIKNYIAEAEKQDSGKH